MVVGLARSQKPLSEELLSNFVFISTACVVEMKGLPHYALSRNETMPFQLSLVDSMKSWLTAVIQA